MSININEMSNESNISYCPTESSRVSFDSKVFHAMPSLIIELADCHKYFTEIPNWTIKKQINPCIDLSSLNAKLLNMVSQYVHNK